MSEAAAQIDDEVMKCGLLMESAQTHQKLAEGHLDALRRHTQGLDGVVREEIRRTLIEEVRSLTMESDRAAQALRRMQRAATFRGVTWNVGAAVLCTAIPAAAARWVLPSATDITALRAQRDELTRTVAQLEQRGGKIEWRRCGDAGRLCVRVDRKAPLYGENADYYVVKGY